MSFEIKYFVEQIRTYLMADLAIRNESNLFDIAVNLIKRHDPTHFEHICQAYEVVKHELIG
ncbi:hypothetical protein [Solibacillus sp. FSL H8-0538]|uniref:hypothetical protein n=1 Tax=Solibacillus sp. FSL H8-0538 TaxID=2921400 RepID=UPI0030F61A4F